MASYRLLYDSKQHVMRYRSAAIYCPLILFVYSCFALYFTTFEGGTTFYVDLLALVSSLYLALHYTGQAWGMVAVFCHLGGAALDASEKRILRGTLWGLCFWHIAWALPQLKALPVEFHEFALVLYDFAKLVYLLASAAGLWVLLRRLFTRGQLIPARALVAYTAIFFWYALVAVYPASLVCVQLFHALQYLIFPLRVELNRHAKHVDWKPRNPILYMLIYYALLLLTGYFAFVWVKPVLGLFGSNFLIHATVVGLCINIHHFYIDGCVWKLRNPEVRKDLFWHLQQNA